MQTQACLHVEVVTGADQDVGTETHRGSASFNRAGARWVFFS
jgi:hypothetical protein